MDRSLIEAAINAQKQVLIEKTPPSPMPPPSMTNSGDYMLGNSMNSLTSGSSGVIDPSKQGLNKNNEEDLLGKENINASVENTDEFNAEPPAIVIYMVDPFSFGPASDNSDVMRMTTLGMISHKMLLITIFGHKHKNILFNPFKTGRIVHNLPGGFPFLSEFV